MDKLILSDKSFLEDASSITIKDTKIFDAKGITPKYVDKSQVIVLNQKCIHDGIIDWSFAQYISNDQRIPDSKYIVVGDLLINSTGTGTAGRSAYVSELPDGYQVVIDSHMLIVRFEDSKLSKYFAYFLYSQEARIKTLLIGSSGQGELDKMSVFSIKFPYNKSALSIFVKLLDIIDRKIALNCQISAKLEVLARDLYNYWFIQFDFPDENNRPYKTNGGEMAWNKELKQEIPAGWKIVKIGSLYTENEKSKIKVRDAKNNKICKYPFFTSGKAILKYDDYFVDGNNLFLNTGGNADVKYFKGKAAYSTDAYSITSEYINYLHLFLQSRISDINENYFAGSSLKHLQKNDFKSIQVVLPPIDLLIKFEKIVDVNMSYLMKNSTENTHLAELRDFLLPMLMNGQVSVN